MVLNLVNDTVIVVLKLAVGIQTQALLRTLEPLVYVMVFQLFNTIIWAAVAKVDLSIVVSNAHVVTWYVTSNRVSL